MGRGVKGVLVRELAGDEQEPRAQNDEAGGDGDRVKVLDLDVAHHVVLVVERHFVQIAVLGLHQEEEQALFACSTKGGSERTKRKRCGGRAGLRAWGRARGGRG